MASTPGMILNREIFCLRVAEIEVWIWHNCCQFGFRRLARLTLFCHFWVFFWRAFHKGNEGNEEHISTSCWCFLDLILVMMLLLFQFVSCAVIKVKGGGGEDGIYGAVFAFYSWRIFLVAMGSEQPYSGLEII